MSNRTHTARRRVLWFTFLVVAAWLVAVRVLGTALYNRAAEEMPPARPPAALDTADDYLAQGDYDFDRGDYSQAIRDYGQALALRPDYAEAFNNRAYTHMKLEQYDKALPDLDQAIRLRPGYVNALMNRGDIHNYYYQVDRQLAMQDYDRVLAIDPHAGSLCGHRLLASHNGWNVGVLAELMVHRTAAGCTEARAR